MAQKAIQSIGLGYDITEDLRLKYCKGNSPDSHLIKLDVDQGRDVFLPGGILVENVSKSIKCDKGERMRFRSDVLSFQQMSEQFNQELSLSGKIPSGLFNTMFEFSGGWQKDAANTKNLAFDGWFIILYTVALAKSQITLRDHVKRDVPSSWDPAALAGFIEKYGTHIIVSVKMGGKDVVYVKQQHNSNLQPTEIQKRLKDIADERYSDANGRNSLDSEDTFGKDKIDIREHKLRFANSSSSITDSYKEELTWIFKRRGGSDNNLSLSHTQWLNTVPQDPDVISMSFVPITSLLNGVPGSGFLSHAVNLYLRYKPPIEQLPQFLEFQLPRQWAPVFSELPLGPQRKQQCNSYLQFSFMGPKLFVNTNPVDVGRRPVTGLRLYLEGKKSNRLAIHLQHLSALPSILHLSDTLPHGHSPGPGPGPDDLCQDRRYFEALQWRHFSHICTAPVDRGDDPWIVTGAQLLVHKNILFLRLKYSAVNAKIRRSDWERSEGLGHKSGILSTLISTHFTGVVRAPTPRPSDVVVNSAVYPGGPPVPVRTPRMLSFVDAAEMARGPQDAPGYWVVTGGKLCVDRGRISISVRYSLLTIVPEVEDEE
ncbi:hypothetical protein AMTRI_Chr11g157920 [Amborella trichopoda]